jgi:hypothetical protein
MVLHFVEKYVMFLGTRKGDVHDYRGSPMDPVPKKLNALTK